MDAAVGHQRNPVVNALSDRQPVQRVRKYGSDVLVESSASDEARSGVQYGLQTPEQRTSERRTRPRCSSPPTRTTVWWDKNLLRKSQRFAFVLSAGNR